MIQNDIEKLIKPTIEDMGYILWACEYLGQSKPPMLRIYIDKENGVGISDCEIVSRQVSAILDVEDAIHKNYTLEVSSPGIPRPLMHKWHFDKNIGKEVNIKLYNPLDGKRKFTGIIISTNENEVVLAVDGINKVFTFSNITKTYLTVERGEQ